MAEVETVPASPRESVGEGAARAVGSQAHRSPEAAVGESGMFDEVIGAGDGGWRRWWCVGTAAIDEGGAECEEEVG